MAENNSNNEEDISDDDDEIFEGDIFAHLKKEDLPCREYQCNDLYAGEKNFD